MDSITDKRINLKTPWIWLALILVGISLIALVGPEERSLGVNVRIVYLHGAWVWTALLTLTAAGVIGIVGLATRKMSFVTWCTALGRSGLIFWVTYLPISLWAMEANWNGLFLTEPRWRVAVIFAVSGILLQAGLVLIRRPNVYLWGNVMFVVALWWVLQNTDEVMHPASPILESGSQNIRVFFFVLVLLTLTASWQLSRLMAQLERFQDSSV